MSKDPGSEKKKLEKRISTIKTSIQNIEWKKDYKDNLHELVLKVNLLVTHAYAFSKYIFIKELETDPTFDLNSSISSKFFTEVFITLTNTKQLVNRVNPETAIIRTLLWKHREDYLRHSKFRPPSFSYAQQNALYEAQKIFTAYTNNISGNFGNILRKFINKLLRKEERVKELKLRMEKSNYSKKQIDNMIRTTITSVCTKVKLAISKKDINQIPKDFLTEDKLKLLQEFISAYPLNYQFDKDSIYYDVKSRPENHFKPFFVLSKLCECHDISVPVCFPLRKTNIPCHITIDTKILKEQIIKAPKSKDNKMEAWARVVNLGCKAFKEQGQKSILIKFQGMILTDGISVSIIKQNFEPGKGSLGGKSSVDKVGEISTYVEDVDISNTEGKCVLIDPGRRDLMFCIHESSTPTNPQMLRYTQNSRAYETKSRHYRKIRQSLKPDEIEALELELSKVPSSTVNVSKYETYLQTRGRVDELLKRYYSCESQAAYDAFRFEDYGVSLKVDENCCLVFQAQHKSNSRKRNAMTITRIKGYYPRNRNNDDNDSAYNLGLALMEPHFTNRMTEEDKVEAQMLVEKFYDKSLSLKEFEDLSSLILKKLLLIPFRKLRFSTYVNGRKSDQLLVKNMQTKFNQDAILIYGNWSAGNSKYHEPIRGKGIRSLLKKGGFTVLLIDEYKTSTFCPQCKFSPVEKFKKIDNPRKHNRHKMPQVLCHGLLRCTNRKCLESNMRLWNRDVVGALNFRHILNELRSNKSRPARFVRSHTISTASSASSSSSSSSSSTTPSKRKGKALPNQPTTKKQK